MAQTIKPNHPVKPSSAAGTDNVLPDWCGSESLALLSVTGKPLDQRQTLSLLSFLSRLTLEDLTESRIADLRKELTEAIGPVSLSGFLWDVFDRWQKTKPISKCDWPLIALGVWGDDHTAMKLATAIQNWPATGKLNRAEVALEVLGVIGTPTALSYVQRHARGHIPIVFSRRSKAVYERIAAGRGLSTDELDDRIVPGAGLGRHCRRIFDFGPRQFTAELTAELKPVVLDAKGKKKRGLPSIADSDDPALAAQAVREWPLFVEQVTLIRDVQPRRFEQALVNGRSWSRGDFEKYVLGHPVTGKLAKRLIWRAFSKDGQTIGSFRVSEDDTYSDRYDRLFSMPDDAVFKLAHPLHLDESERQRWSQIFIDYFISQPFPQLERTVIPMDSLETSNNRITGVPQLEVQPDMNEITGNLLLLNWGLTPMLEPTLGKYFFTIINHAGVSAVLGFSKNVGPGFSFKECFFIEGKPGDSFFPENAEPMALSRLDPVLVSETLVGIRKATAKGK